MADLSTTYLGLNLKNPLVPSSSPLCRDLDVLRQMEDSGAAAVVLHSLFEEQIKLEGLRPLPRPSRLLSGYAEDAAHFWDLPDYRAGPEVYLEHIVQAKKALSIPVIASLNGVSSGGWVNYARDIERAGADALELNMYFLPTDPSLRGDQVEDQYADLVVDIKRVVTIPLAVKLSPFFSSLSSMAQRLTRAGARGLVLFNRFYQPDIDPARLSVRPRLVLSSSSDLLLPVRWIAILYGQVPADLALTSGVHTANDVLKGLLAGARITMLASELIQNGVGRLTDILQDLQAWFHEHEYESVAQIRGRLSQLSSPAPAAFERTEYLKTLAAPSYFDASSTLHPLPNSERQL